MSTISHPVTFTVAERQRRYGAVLRFTVNRPFEVAADFGPGTDGKGRVVWTFDRDLLRDGLTGLAGRGDMQCWTREPYYYIALSSPNGRATPRFLADEVRGFLIDAEDLVPYGAEVMDFDDELVSVLTGGDR